MRYRGVVYDVGLRFVDALVDHDMHVIAKDLHANAVCIEGEPIASASQR